MTKQEDQLTLSNMRTALNEFKTDHMPLDALVTLVQTLEKGLESLKQVKDDWREAFRTEWWEIELLTAVMIDNGMSEVDPSDKDTVEETKTAINNMLKLLEHATY